MTAIFFVRRFRTMHLILTVFLYYAVISLVESVIGFNQRCPWPYEWRFRREKCTTPQRPFYACLYNEFSLQYSENCTRKEYESQKGRRVVFGPGISETDCADSRFQPFKFTTHSFSDCIYSKSTCSEEGQVLVKNGSRFIDRSCRCDYRKGYDYITQPKEFKDKCSCVPSLKDCSCYLTNCTGNSALTQDYECVLKIDSRSGSNVCGKILTGSHANITTNTNNTFVDKKEHSSTSAFTASISILIFMLITVVLILMLWVLLNKKVMPHITETKGISDGIIYIEDDIPKIYHLIEGDSFTIRCEIRSLLHVKSVRWQKDGSNINLQSYKHEMNDHYTSLTIENLSENDTGTYTCIVSNWLSLNNTSVDKCVCHLSALHRRMTWVQTLHQFKACRKEDQNRITVNIHQLPQPWKDEEKKIGEEVKMNPSTDKDKELMEPLEFIKSVVWFHITKDKVRVVKRDQYGDINDGYSKQGQQGDKHDGTFKADQHGDTKEGDVKAKQQGDANNGTVKSDQHGDINDGCIKAKQQGDTNDRTVIADKQGDTKDKTVRANQHGATNDGTVKADQQGDTKDKTFIANQHGDTKEGAVKTKQSDTKNKTVIADQHGDAKDATVVADEHGDTKDGGVKADQQGDTKDGPVKVDQQVDTKDGPVKADQQGDTKDGAVKADQQGDKKDGPVKTAQQGDTKDGAVKADEQGDTKDGTGKPDEHGDVKDGAVKHDVIKDEGTWDRYALAFNTTFSHNGQYVCFVVGNGNIISIGWRLKVIPEGNVCKEVMDHREDESYVKTSPVHVAMKCLENNGFVVITGRKGTGKTKMKLQLVSLFQEKDYLPFEVNEKSLNKTLKDDLKTTKVIFLIDHIVNDPKVLGEMLEKLPDVSNNCQKKIIFTCRKVELPRVKPILQRKKLYNTKAFIDLDNILTVDDKRNILENHIKVSNKSVTYSDDTEILNKDELKPLELGENVVLEIIKTEPFIGFPFMASNFCSKTKNFNKGKIYFTNPPTFLVDEIRALYHSALKKKEPELMEEYCVLVYLATDERLCLDVSVSSAAKFRQLKQLIFEEDERKKDNEMMRSIKDAAEKLVANNKYIMNCDDHTYRFIHPYVSKAIFLSSENLLNYFIENGDVEDIIEFVRGCMYNAAEDELVLIVKDEDKYNVYHVLCERLTVMMAKESDLGEMIGNYMYEYFIQIRDIPFLQVLFLKLKCFSPLNTKQDESPPKKIGKKESLNVKDDRHTDKAEMDDSYYFKTPNRSEEPTTISFFTPSQMITLIEQLTRIGKDSWIYRVELCDVPDFVVLYGLIIGCKNNFLSDAEQNKTFFTILNIFTDNLKKGKSFRLKCCTPLDTYDNKFCHFLTLFSESESCLILEKLIEHSEKNKVLKVKHIFKESPLNMAAYLGKAKLFKAFSLESKKKKNKRDKIYEVIKNGKEIAFCTSNFDHDLRKSICVGKQKAYSDIIQELKSW